MQLIKHGRLICQQLEETGLISMSVKDPGKYSIKQRKYLIYIKRIKES